MGQGMVTISEPDCTGCDLCIAHCPFEALLPLADCADHRTKRAVIVVEARCVGCLTCIGSCPTGALTEISIPPDAEQSPLLLDTGTPAVESVPRWSRDGIGTA